MSRWLLILVTIANSLQNSAQLHPYDHLRDGYQLYDNVIPMRDDKTFFDLTDHSDEYETNIERNIPLLREKRKKKIYLDNSDTSLSSSELELIESISIPPSLLPSKHKTKINQIRKQQINALKLKPLIMKLSDKTNPNSHKHDKIKLTKLKGTHSPKSKDIRHFGRPNYKPGHRPRPGVRPGHENSEESRVMKSDEKLKRFFPWYRPPGWMKPLKTRKLPKFGPQSNESNES